MKTGATERTELALEMLVLFEMYVRLTQSRSYGVVDLENPRSRRLKAAIERCNALLYEQEAA